MPRPVVFVDTNAVDNSGSVTTFLGGRNDLEKIAKRADIKLPVVVYDEIRKHIKTFLAGQKRSFKTNPHRHILNISDKSIDDVDHDEMVSKLEKSESVKFEVVELIDEASAYKEIYHYAIEGTPPFEKSGDKGFKDALIAKTIDQYDAKNPDAEIFLWTNDDRLKEYFSNTEIQIIDGFQKFDQLYSEDKMEDELLLDRIWSYLKDEGVNIASQREPLDQWQNYEGDIVSIFGEPNGDKLSLKVSSSAREPESYTLQSLDSTIDVLSSVGSFSGAHSAVAEVDSLFSYFSIDQLRTITEIMTTNSQIYAIGGDDDIAQFAERLFNALDSNEEDELAIEIRNRYGLKLSTEEERAQLPF